MPSICIIPARFASVRFPGKPLAAETGRPLIQHVCEAAARSHSVSRIVVATDDDRIAAAVRAFRGEVVMTSPDHPNGASRLAEAADILQLPPNTIVVNAQGDEPELDPALIDAAVAALESSIAPMSTIASPFAPDEDPANPNIVKVVRTLNGDALYFSRALIPHNRDGASSAHDAAAAAPMKHVGLYAYRRAFLAVYVTLPETPLERAERLEQLRVLEHGRRIAVAVAEARHHGIDTPEQYAAFVKRWRAANPAASSRA